MKAIERFYKYLEIKGVRPTKFEKLVGLSNGYLGTQLKRNGSLGEDVIKIIVENCLDISVLWLITGKGEMLLKGVAENQNIDMISDEKKIIQQKILHVERENELLRENCELLKQNNELLRNENNRIREEIAKQEQKKAKQQEKESQNV